MKIKKEYICKECNYKTNGWMGRCPNCGAWDSIEEKILSDENKKLFLDPIKENLIMILKN